MRAYALLLVLLPLAAWATPPAGGGGLQSLPGDELSLEQRARIDAELISNVAALQRSGQLSEIPPLLVPTQGGLQWPLRAVPSYTDPDYHGISNFVDLDPAFPDHLLDWNCGMRTYDQPGGYNHAGIDIFLWPYPWLMMDQQSVDIVAAAPGTIIGKVDGNDDRSCPNHYSADWNAVYVQHADGTVAWYGHMKKLSQTSKLVGATVANGEFLGKVGSAGFSSAPHLHFENHSAVSSYTILEPFHGACNAPASLWAQQRPYYDSGINKLATHFAPPDYHDNPAPNCPNPIDETPNLSDRFLPNQTVYFAAYYRDQLPAQVTTFTVLRPNGTTFATWSFKMSDSKPDPYYAAAYWYWYYMLPSDAPTGLWHLRATYESVTYNHTFFVGDVIFANGFD
ncbi:MAG: peptidoglycan DD-metalloendopeptidase family protein [Dokdonella sp.]